MQLMVLYRFVQDGALAVSTGSVAVYCSKFAGRKPSVLPWLAATTEENNPVPNAWRHHNCLTYVLV
jgi:hypothetical protein